MWNIWFEINTAYRTERKMQSFTDSHSRIRYVYEGNVSMHAQEKFQYCYTILNLNYTVSLWHGNRPVIENNGFS